MIRARRPAAADATRVIEDAAVIDGYLDDASGKPPGTARGIARLRGEADASALLRATATAGTPVLCQAARTSLTGGAIPHDELVLSVERMTTIDPVVVQGEGATVRVDPGVRLDALARELARAGWYYPPVPTYQQAMIGGTVATNAGGAATFKYGVTRQWVRGLSVVLADGDVLDVERGQLTAPAGGAFEIVRSDGGRVSVPAPDYRLPPLRKVSAGYHAADPLDLVDLFVGSEGTLGLIVSITLDLVPMPPSVVTGLVFLDSFAAVLELAGELRAAAIATRGAGDPNGPDVRAIESIDERGVELLRASGAAGRLRVPLPDGRCSALLFEMELARPTGNDDAERAAMAVLDGTDPSPGDRPLTRLFHLLAARGALETLQLAFPDDAARREALLEFREAVPRGVNELLAERRRDAPAVRKIAGDLIVPFDRLAEVVPDYERAFAARGLDYAIWGHLSDGNLHPNALARDDREVPLAIEAVFECADRAVAAGGCPLSEHGVGRDPMKQELLRRFLGDGAIDRMRQIKHALDPGQRFGRGVLFPYRGLSANG